MEVEWRGVLAGDCESHDGDRPVGLSVGRSLFDGVVVVAEVLSVAWVSDECSTHGASSLCALSLYPALGSKALQLRGK